METNNGAYYYDVLKRLCDAYRIGDSDQVNNLADELRKFRCSLLEHDEFMERLKKFIDSIKVDDSADCQKAALKDLLTLIPEEELVSLLPAIQRSFRKLIHFYGLSYLQSLVDKLSCEQSARCLARISDKSKKMFSVEEGLV